MVAPPSRHASGKSYEWVCADLEPVEMPAWLLAVIQRPVPKPPHQGTPGTWDERSANELASALAAIVADAHDVWIQVGAALHHASDGAAEALELWDRWSATARGRYALAECAKRWPTFASRVANRASAATIFLLAEERGWSPTSAQRSSNPPMSHAPACPFI